MSDSDRFQVLVDLLERKFAVVVNAIELNRSILRDIQAETDKHWKYIETHNELIDSLYEWKKEPLPGEDIIKKSAAPPPTLEIGDLPV